MKRFSLQTEFEATILRSVVLSDFTKKSVDNTFYIVYNDDEKSVEFRTKFSDCGAFCSFRKFWNIKINEFYEFIDESEYWFNLIEKNLDINIQVIEL